MGRFKQKTCSISGKRFRATSENFYVNSNAQDNFHPYHKSFDNFRRTTGASVAQCRKLVNLMNA
jgi:ribosomal protein L35